MIRHRFQVNTKFGKNTMSACGILGIVKAKNVDLLLQKISKKFKIPISEVELEFQPIAL